MPLAEPRWRDSKLCAGRAGLGSPGQRNEASSPRGTESSRTRDLRTSLAIAADALGTEIRQKRARFPWDVGAHPPGIAERQQRPIDELVDVRNPIILGCGDCLDRC